MAKPKAPSFPGTSPSAIPRDMRKFENGTGNIYESIAIIAKRANQVSTQLQEDLDRQLKEFGSDNDNLEEVHENREQIELSMAFERLPKPTLIATEEFLSGKIRYRNPAKDAEK